MINQTIELFQACPYCVGQNQDNPASWILIGAFVLLPFVIAPTVAWIIHKSQN
jgi:hypothetical protein